MITSIHRGHNIILNRTGAVGIEYKVTVVDPATGRREVGYARTPRAGRRLGRRMASDLCRTYGDPRFRRRREPVVQ